MKFISLLMFSLLLSAQVQASNALPLSVAALSASDEVEALYGEKSVLAYRAQLKEGEFLVDVLTQFNEDSFAVSYDCHLHGDHAHCHKFAEENFSTELKQGLELELLHAGQKSALSLLTDSLKEKLFSYRVWGVVNHDDLDHGSEEEVWVRFDLDLDGQTRHFFVMCHEHGHGHESADDHDDDHHDLDCHVERNSDFVPSFPEL